MNWATPVDGGSGRNAAGMNESDDNEDNYERTKMVSTEKMRLLRLSRREGRFGDDEGGKWGGLGGELAFGVGGGLVVG